MLSENEELAQGHIATELIFEFKCHISDKDWTQTQLKYCSLLINYNRKLPWEVQATNLSEKIKYKHPAKSSYSTSRKSKLNPKERLFIIHLQNENQEMVLEISQHPSLSLQVKTSFEII